MKKTFGQYALPASIIIVLLIIVYVFSTYSIAPQTTNETTSTTTVATTSTTTATTKQTASKTASSVKTKVTVVISNFAFSPQNLTIKKGTTVTWINRDSAGHTVTADAMGPTSATLGTGDSYSYTFNTAGIYGYHCSIHPMMTGTVVVQ